MANEGELCSFRSFQAQAREQIQALFYQALTTTRYPMKDPTALAFAESFRSAPLFIKLSNHRLPQAHQIYPTVSSETAKGTSIKPATYLIGKEKHNQEKLTIATLNQ